MFEIQRRAAKSGARLATFGRLHYVRSRVLVRLLCLLILGQLSLSVAIAQKAVRSPSDTIRQFYKAMHEKRFKEAFAMSVYKNAVEGLTPQQFEDLKPDFDNMAAAIPEKVEISGEQISGDVATVFVKDPSSDDPAAAPQPAPLIRVNGEWIIGNEESQALVNKAGKDFFFNLRITTHQNDVTDMLQKISVAELVYAQQHNGLYGDLAALIGAGLIPKDIEGTETTGYHFKVNLGKDAKTFTANAEPAQYGRTGKLSFFLDHEGIRSADNAGKPIKGH